MKAYLKTLNVLFFALLTGQIMILIILIFLSPNTEFINSPPFATIGALLMVTQVLLSSYLFKKKLSEIPNHAAIEEKLSKYRTAYIIRWAILESAVLINGVLFFLSENQLNLIFASVVLVVFIISRPSKPTIFNDLDLHGKGIEL